MLEKLLRFVLANRLVTLVLTLAISAAGVQALRSLPIDAFPDVSSTQVKIILKSPGMTPEEVETRVVTPLEIELLSIPNKRVVRSVSKYAIADITIDFVDGTDIYWARQRVLERLNSATSSLPSDVTPTLGPDGTGVCWPGWMGWPFASVAGGPAAGCCAAGCAAPSPGVPCGTAGFKICST